MPDLKTHIRRLENAREADKKQAEEVFAALSDLYQKNSNFSRPELAKRTGENPATLNLHMAQVRKAGVKPGHSRDAAERLAAWETALKVITEAVRTREEVRKTREARDKAIEKAYSQGTPIADIAKTVGMNWSSVKRIIQAYRYRHSEPQDESGENIYPTVCKAIAAEKKVHQHFSQMMELNPIYTRQDIAAAFAWGYNRLQNYYRSRPKAVITDELKKNPPTLEQVAQEMNQVEQLWEKANTEALNYLETVQKHADDTQEALGATRRDLMQAWTDARAHASFKGGARDAILAEKSGVALSTFRSYINTLKKAFDCTPSEGAADASEADVEEHFVSLYRQVMEQNQELAKARDNRKIALRILLKLLENHPGRILRSDITEKLNNADSGGSGILYHMRTGALA